MHSAYFHHFKFDGGFFCGPHVVCVGAISTGIKNVASAAVGGTALYMSVRFCWSVVGLRSSLSLLIFCPPVPSSAGGVGTEMREYNCGFLHFSSQLYQFLIPVF